MTGEIPDSGKFSVHQLVLDLRHHSAWIYWADLLFSACVFWFCMITLGFAGLGWQINLLLICVGSLALYRAALFVHEIGHFSRSTLPGFEVAWNVLIGWPLLFPSFLMQSHPDHHRMASFGTAHDPEYLPFASAPRKMRIWFLASSAMTPLILLLRATLLVPLGWLHARVRQWLRRYASRMTMNNAYQPAPQAQKLSIWHEISEGLTACFAWCWLMAAALGYLPWILLSSLVLCMAIANVLNSWRTLHAHAYVSGGAPTDQIGQLRDSTTLLLPPLLGELIAPVGQRFHAAHHLFPYLPYHSLAEADRRVRRSSWDGREVYIQTVR
jgi:fatty acid desaturase